MARELREYGVTIPKGTTKTTPRKVALAMPPRVVVQITVRIPPGPRGTMGFAVGSAGLAVIPVNPGAYIVTDDATLLFPLTDYIDSGTWWLIGYNTGTYTHTVYLTFTCTLPGTAQSPGVQPGVVSAVGAAIGTGGLSTTAGAGGIPFTPGTIPPVTVPTPPTITPPTPVAVPTPPTITPPTITPPATPPPVTPPPTPATLTPPPPAPRAVWQVAPSSVVHYWGRWTYTPISTYAQALALAATPTTVYLWTTTQTSPSLQQTPASLAAWEHNGDHAYPQYTTYQRS